MGFYSEEFRMKVFSVCDGREDCCSVALRFNMSEFWICRIKQVRRES